MNIFKNKRVVLAVTGGIAAYKSAELARCLMKEGAIVRVVMTESAQKFITPLTFQALTQEPVATELFQTEEEGRIGHISLAEWADIVIIAPATANVIGKMAAGIADDLLTTILLAVTAPVVICPAMNVDMYANPIVQENLARLKAYGYNMVDPGVGLMACGTEGKGRFPELLEIIEETRKVLTEKDLLGLRILVSSGPAREKWDDIRFISNLSTGKMGHGLARRAWHRGAEVTLVTGPTSLADPHGPDTIHVTSTAEMGEAVLKRFQHTDVLIMAAAPMDFRPKDVVKGKIKKGGQAPVIELELNPDFFVEAGKIKDKQILVGFAAEAENMLENAKGKLKNKNMDFIVANQIGKPGVAFGSDTNEVSIIDRDGVIKEIPKAEKDDIADIILDKVLDVIKAKA